MQPNDKDRPDPPTATAAKPVELPPFPGSAAERPPTTATTGEEVRAVVLGGLAGVGFGLMLMTVGVLLFHAPAGGALLVLLVGGVLGAVVVGTHSAGAPRGGPLVVVVRPARSIGETDFGRGRRGDQDHPVLRRERSRRSRRRPVACGEERRLWLSAPGSLWRGSRVYHDPARSPPTHARTASVTGSPSGPRQH
jgi:hypothetical protein